MFFDLHCHPSFKTLLGNRQPDLRKDCWSNLDFGADFKILDSQSSLSQIKAGNGKLIISTLYALENALAGSGLIKLAAGLTPHVEKRFLQEIYRKKWSYQKLMFEDYHHLLKSRNISSEKSFRLLQKMADYQPDSDQIQVVLAAEGGHNFYHDNQQAGPQEQILDNLMYHKQPGNPRLFYVTLTHLQQSDFCTHAYGMKLIKNPRFDPAGQGLRSLGRAFIRAALSEANGPRILIDVKHMSLKSRLSFYQLRKDEFPHSPVLATHMGITGISFGKKPVKKVQTNIKRRCVQVFYYRVPGAVDTYFNPWSINLYDEDIREIMKSRGLIGLSLDQRILGCGNVSKEHFSTDEFNHTEFKPVGKPSYHKLKPTHYDTASKIKDWQIRHFCNNWMHVIRIGRPVLGEEVWDHVCIGSDFDGLIDPLDDFKSAASYKFLFDRLVEWLPPMAHAVGINLPAAQVQEKVRKLVFDNGLKFLQIHFV